MNVLCKHKYYLLKMQIFFETILKIIAIVSKCKKKRLPDMCKKWNGIAAFSRPALRVCVVGGHSVTCGFGMRLNRHATVAQPAAAGLGYAAKTDIPAFQRI